MKNDFDKRWQHLAGLAGRAEESAAEVPWGLTTRVLAHSRTPNSENALEIWSRLSIRALLIATGLFLLSGGYALMEWYDFRIEAPALERSLTSELSWP